MEGGDAQILTIGYNREYMERQIPCPRKYWICTGPHIEIIDGMPILVCGLDLENKPDGYRELVLYCKSKMGPVVSDALQILFERSKSGQPEGGSSDP